MADAASSSVERSKSDKRKSRNLSLEISQNSSYFNKIDAKQFLQWLDEDKNNAIVLVDVRGKDTEGGVLRGAQSAPWSDFESNVKEYVQKWSSAAKVIFHCTYGVERSVTCAQIFSAALQSDQDAKGDDDTASGPEVYVLNGGYAGLVLHFNDATVDAAGKTPISLRKEADKYLQDFKPDMWLITDLGHRCVFKHDVELVDQKILKTLL